MAYGDEGILDVAQRDGWLTVVSGRVCKFSIEHDATKLTHAAPLDYVQESARS